MPLRETKPKSGAVMIAVRSGAPILPICIKTKGNRFSMFKPTRLIIGRPISVAELGLDEHASGEFSRASQAVFDEICRLEESSADA